MSTPNEAIYIMVIIRHTMMTFVLALSTCHDVIAGGNESDPGMDKGSSP